MANLNDPRRYPGAFGDQVDHLFDEVYKRCEETMRREFAEDIKEMKARLRRIENELFGRVTVPPLEEG